jgi:SNF2 family DNA or RNA helicase
MNIKEFFEKHGNVLKKKALQKLRPISNIEGGVMDEADKKLLGKLSELNREPFYAQATTINSLAKAFYIGKRKSLILCGEMGTGKTLIGSAVAYLNPKQNNRTLILCPPHLVRKWEREILATIPDAKVKLLVSVSDIELTKPIGREFWVLSRERAKLHYKDMIVLGENRNGYHCQYCSKPIVARINGKTGELVIDKDEHEAKNGGGGKTKCPHCGAVLLQPTYHFRRYALAEYIQRHKKHCRIDLLVADEMHELKSGESAQGDAFHALCTASRRVLGMTGTLMGGKSTDLYYLLFRMFPRKMVERGYKHNSATEFSRRYGIQEVQITCRERGTNRVASMGKDSVTKSAPREKPGVSPTLLPHFILEDSIFLFIDDISASMPPYQEFVEMVEMDDNQYAEYKKFEYRLIELVRTTSRGGGASRFLGALVQSLYALPDGVRRGEEVFDPQSPDPNNPTVVLRAEPLDIPITAKEARLLELIQEEKAQGRRCAVFLEHTGTRNLIPDLAERLEEANLKTLALPASLDTGKREEWIAKHVKDENPDVLITNPRNVQTGLDLLAFPTIIYFQTGYSIYTLRQSSRRSWRIGQELPVKVYFLAYSETAQERALKLIAAKLETSNAVEGKLSADGLSSMSESQNSLMYELARSILNGDKDDKKSAAEAWNAKNRAEKAAAGVLAEANAASLREKVTELIKPKGGKKKLEYIIDYKTGGIVNNLETYFNDAAVIEDAPPKIRITPIPTPPPVVSAETEAKAMDAGSKGREVRGRKGSYRVFDLEAYLNALEGEGA